MKRLLIALILACSGTVIAQVPTMEVNSASVVRNFTLSDIRKITFNTVTDDMIIHLTASPQVSYPIADIRNITFLHVDAPAAIEEAELTDNGKRVQKILRNGHPVIMIDTEKYDMMGRRLK